MFALDHIVFNTRDRIDAVVELFQRLGFTVAPRGHHTLGSINHVIVFGTDYLELLGYPPGKPPAGRPELAAHPIGLMATVLATEDADATRAGLIARGLRPRPVQAFSRPVDLGRGRIQDAAFRVTRLEPDAVPGTWFYYCQHLTRSLVWRPEWQAHANGATAMCALDIDVPDLAAAAPAYRQCTQAGTSETLGASHSSSIFPLQGCDIRLHQRAGAAQMRGLTLRVSSIETAAQCLRQKGIRFDRSGTEYPAANVAQQVIRIDPAATFGVTLQLAALAQ